MIYFDNAATTKMSTEALKVYTEVAQQFYANSDSLHILGNQSSNLILQVKSKISQLLHVPADGLIFTSGGTQSNQIGIESLVEISEKRDEVLVSPLEHSSIYQVLERLERRNKFKICFLPVTENGKVLPEALENGISERTALIVVQAVNSVTGIIQDISALKLIAKRHDIPFFMDAVQAVTKIPLDYTDISGFSVSAHKFNGPKGCGLLFLSPESITVPSYNNVFQQNGFLPGTLDVPGISSMTTALQYNFPTIEESLEKMHILQSKLKSLISKDIRMVVDDYPGICGLILPRTQGQEAVTKMGQLGFCISTVSACSILDPRPDRTLLSLGLSPTEVSRYIRVSLGSDNSVDEIEKFVATLNNLFG